MNFAHALRRNMTHSFNGDLEFSLLLTSLLFGKNNKILCFWEDLE